jgi:hypothetical protein
LPGGVEIVRLFHPRGDLWRDHFAITGARIMGLTDIGRATAALLRFNDSDRLLEREELIRVGRYPSKRARE